MVIQSILAELVEPDRRSLAAIFVDDSGELVGMECRRTPAEGMTELAAYLAIYVRRVRDSLESGGLGAPARLEVERDGLRLHAAALPDGYLVGLVERPTAPAATGRRRLERAVRRLSEELFDA